MEMIFNGFLTTSTITIVALVFGLFLGTILAMFRTLNVPVADKLARVYIDTFRSLPLVLIIFGLYLVAPGIVKSIFGINGDIRMACALIAFSLFEAAYFAEILRSGFNAIPKNQLAACRSNGFTRLQSYRYVLIPQAIKNSLPVILTQAIILFQDTALVYVIGLTDFFGAMVKMGEMNGSMPGMIMAGSAAYLVICVALQRVANRLQKGSV